MMMVMVMAMVMVLITISSKHKELLFGKSWIKKPPPPGTKMLQRFPPNVSKSFQSETFQWGWSGKQQNIPKKLKDIWGGNQPVAPTHPPTPVRYLSGNQSDSPTHPPPQWAGVWQGKGLRRQKMRICGSGDRRRSWRWWLPSSSGRWQWFSSERDLEDKKWEGVDQGTGGGADSGIWQTPSPAATFDQSN